MNEVKQDSSLTIIFENCEEITIDSNFIQLLEVNNIKDDLLGFLCAGWFHVAIDRDAESFYEVCDILSKRTNFKRVLDFADITIIKVKNKKDEIKEYFVDYEEDEHGFNRLSNSYLDEKGNLHIIIGNNKNCKEGD